MFKGTPLINRANSPFSATLTAQWEKAKSVVFAFSRVKIKNQKRGFACAEIKIPHANLAERDGCDLQGRFIHTNFKLKNMQSPILRLPLLCPLKRRRRLWEKEDRGAFRA